MAAHDTAHLDGLRVGHVYADDGIALTIELWAGGRRAPELFEPVALFQADDTEVGRAAVDRRALVLKALCDFVNYGGSHMMDLVDGFRTACPSLRPPLRLVSVLPPSGGNTVVWARPDGTFLRVVEGEDGFTEVLTADELRQADEDRLPGM